MQYEQIVVASRFQIDQRVALALYLALGDRVDRDTTNSLRRRSKMVALLDDNGFSQIQTSAKGLNQLRTSANGRSLTPVRTRRGSRQATEMVDDRKAGLTLEGEWTDA